VIFEKFDNICGETRQTKEKEHWVSWMQYSTGQPVDSGKIF
jgi:hypothetical protein